MKKNKTERKQKEVKDMVVVDGTVVEAFANAMFDVKLDNGAIIRCTVAGNMRNNRFKIRVNPDDRVQVGISIYNNTVGRILYRYN
jgi:translation initiation factor IF-1